MLIKCVCGLNMLGNNYNHRENVLFAKCIMCSSVRLNTAVLDVSESHVGVDESADLFQTRSIGFFFFFF